jgi:hypothetical protein
MGSAGVRLAWLLPALAAPLLPPPPRVALIVVACPVV